MRDIKFRVWCCTTKKMYYDWGVLFGNEKGNRVIHDMPKGFDIVVRPSSNIVIMQFTGLVDRDGKDIYEGDVIKTIMYDKPYSAKKKSKEVLFKVVWDAGTFIADDDDEFYKDHTNADPSCYNRKPGFMAMRIFKSDEYQNCAWSAFAGCRVVGNIYED